MLQQKTGCRIQVSKDEGQPMRDITLTGGPREMEYAQKEILTLAGQVSSPYPYHVLHSFFDPSCMFCYAIVTCCSRWWWRWS
jgi:hypothetical protein